MKHIIDTDLDLNTLISKIEGVTLPYEKVNTTQFQNQYYYKGKVSTNKFIIEDIYVGYNNPSDIIKGEIVLKDNNAIIYIEIENTGGNLIRVMFLALILPFFLVMSLVLAFKDCDFTLLFCLIIFSFVLFAIKKQPNVNSREEEIINTFKKNIGI